MESIVIILKDIHSYNHEDDAKEEDPSHEEEHKWNEINDYLG